LIISLAVFGHQATVVSAPIPHKVWLAEVRRSKSVDFGLTLAVLLIPVERIERSGCAGKDQSIVLLQQTQQRNSAREIRNVAPLIRGLLSLVGKAVQIVSRLVLVVVLGGTPSFLFIPALSLALLSLSSPPVIFVATTVLALVLAISLAILIVAKLLAFALVIVGENRRD
jgi:hypothetical protein